MAVSSECSDADQTVGDSQSPRPSWARWNGDLGARYTLGVEEELMLLTPSDGSLAQSSDVVLAGLSDQLAAHASPETHAGVVELATGVHPDVDGAVAELASLRSRLSLELDTLGLTVAAAGTHPFTTGEETEVSGAVRYRALDDSLRVLAHREPTMALHVHVGAPAAEDAVRLLNRLRHLIPVLLALSANSPFCHGRDTGFAPARTPIFQAFPRAGPPRFFSDYGDYVEAVDALIAPGAIRDPSFVWWDVRLQPGLGTVEVRVMDAQSTVRELAPLVALVQSLAHLELEGDAPPADRVRWLATATGADRQRAFAAGTGSLEDLVATLAERFLAPGELAKATERSSEQVRHSTERSGPCAAGSHTPVPQF